MVVPTAFLYLIPYGRESSRRNSTLHTSKKYIIAVTGHWWVYLYINPFSMDGKDVIRIIFVRFHSHFIFAFVLRLCVFFFQWFPLLHRMYSLLVVLTHSSGEYHSIIFPSSNWKMFKRKRQTNSKNNNKTDKKVV